MRDYESYNMLGDEIEKDNKQTQEENTELVTVETALQPMTENTQVSETAQETTYYHDVNDYLEETYHYEMPNNETDDTETTEDTAQETQESKTASNENKEKENKEKFKIKFPTFKKYNERRERKTWEKVLMVLGVIALLIFLSPFIICVVATLALILGGLAMTTFGSMFAGIFAIGMTCFIATQLTPGLIVAGLSLGICGITFGLIVLLLLIMLVKWSIKHTRAKIAKKRGI